jgi:glycine/D-amino acid oxidase-like deaminating enzyme
MVSPSTLQRRFHGDLYHNTGGHVRPDVHIGLPRRDRLYGREATQEIADFEIDNLQAIRELVRRDRVECDLSIMQTMTVFPAHTAQMAEDTKSELARLADEAGYPTAKTVHVHEGKAAQTFSGLKDAQTAFSYEAASIWPYKFVMSLLANAVSRGVKLQTHTPVTAVSEARDDKGYWTVSTPRGNIKAKTVIFASNGYTSAILPEYKDRIIPVKGICSRIVVPDDMKAPHLPSSNSVRHGPGLFDYQITRPDGSIVVGGSRTELLPRPEEWYNVWDDSAVFEPAARYFDGLMQRTYWGWENTDARVDSVWTGIMGVSLPHRS